MIVQWVITQTTNLQIARWPGDVSQNMPNSDTNVSARKLAAQNPKCLVVHALWENLLLCGYLKTCSLSKSSCLAKTHLGVWLFEDLHGVPCSVGKLTRQALLYLSAYPLLHAIVRPCTHPWYALSSSPPYLPDSVVMVTRGSPPAVQTQCCGGCGFTIGHCSTS